MDELIWPALRGIGTLLFWIFIELIPDAAVWLWRTIRRTKEPPMDFSEIQQQRKTKRQERRTQRREKRQNRIENRGNPIE